MVDSPSAREATIVVPLPGEIDLANATRVGEELNAAFGPVPPGEVRRVLEILRLDTVLAIYPRLDVALVAGNRNHP